MMVANIGGNLENAKVITYVYTLEFYIYKNSLIFLEAYSC